MSFADDIRPALAHIRAIPGQLGIRPHSVILLSRSWSGGQSGDGERNDVTVSLSEAGQNPKVRWMSDEELAVGDIERGTVEIGPITSDHSGHKYLGDIRGDSLSDSDARYLLITGPKHPCGAQYRIARLTVDRALHYTLRAYPVDNA